MTSDPPHLPDWAPRVSRVLIRRFYEMSESGILDDDLIDEVGVALYARCYSMIEVKEAKRGQVRCPACGSIIQRERPLRLDGDFSCGQCPWTCDWPTYRSSFKGALLNPGQIETQIRAFLRDYAGAREPRQKVVLIDTLIHLIHDETGGGNKPGAYAFIEGEISDVAAFLDGLTYGADIPEEVKERRMHWRRKVKTGKRFWSDQIKDFIPPSTKMASDR